MRHMLSVTFNLIRYDLYFEAFINFYEIMVGQHVPQNLSIKITYDCIHKQYLEKVTLDWVFMKQYLDKVILDFKVRKNISCLKKYIYCKILNGKNLTHIKDFLFLFL